MTKDYAKYTSIKRVPKKKPQRHVMLSIVLFIFVALFGYGYYLVKLHPSPGMLAFLNEIKPFFHHKPKQPMVAVKSQPVIAKTEDEIHFDFYNELPNMHVKNTAIAEKNTAPTNYILKINSYKNKNEASQMRISLLLSGVDVAIVKMGESYRLQQGPYSTLSQAKAMQKNLQDKGIESSVEKG